MAKNIIDADYRLFYVHRGMEKTGGNPHGYNEVTLPVGIACVVSAAAHSTAYTTSVEKRDGHSGAGACADDPRHSAGSGAVCTAPAEPRPRLATSYRF